jgi:hypothetical protein
MRTRRTTIRFNRKPVEQITDRAKRYRAHANAPEGPKQCGFCGRRKNIDLHHITGNEADAEPENFMWACRKCNTKVSILMDRAGVGVKTHQFNAARGRGLSRRDALREYGNAIKVMRGDFEGDVSAAVATIRATPPDLRRAYTSRTWPARRALYGPSGRQGKLFGDVPF